MPTTSLSSKGQIIIPKPIRSQHHWHPGQKFEVIDTAEGLLLKEAAPFVETSLDQVAACLPYSGKAKTLAEMEEAIQRGATETADDRG